MPAHRGEPRCAVVVVNYNSSALLEANLLCVNRDNPDMPVYVVDNTASAHEHERVERLCAAHGWTGIYPGHNLGFGEGCNVAATQAVRDGAEQLLLLNPDAYLDATSLARLRRAVTADPQALVGPTITTAGGRVWSAGVDLLLDTGSMRGWSRRAGVPPPRSVAWLSGACLLLSAELWQRVDGFDPDYFLYWEDVDLSARVQQHGGTVQLVPGAVARHDEGATHRSTRETTAKSPVYYYYNVRNRMLFATKHLDHQGVKRWGSASVTAAYQTLLRGGRRQFLRPHLSVWPVVRGLVAGARCTHQDRFVRVGPRRGTSS